jgi:hypothetical protein
MRLEINIRKRVSEGTGVEYGFAYSDHECRVRISNLSIDYRYPVHLDCTYIFIFEILFI